MPNIHSHYETLFVARNAPDSVIRAAYKTLSQAVHPDKNPHPDAADAMQQVNTAYETLSDPEKRLGYHQWLEAEEYKWTLRHPALVPQNAAVTRRGQPFEMDEQAFAAGIMQWKPIRPLWQRAGMVLGAFTMPGMIFAVYLAISKG